MTSLPCAAVVINPTKWGEGLAEATETIARCCCEQGWAAPLLFHTTAEDPGFGQTQQALAAHPAVVLACGGDGTVRAVAEQLAGTEVPLGVLPAGTGNLLARNLNLALDDLAAAMTIALTGHTRVVDVGWVSGDGGQEQAFLVMTGMGFDAEIMADAPEAVKAKLGALAYVASGLRRLKGQRVRAWVRIDDGPELAYPVRSVMVGNCGAIQGGITLMPDAAVDDGKLDLLVLSPKGVWGWVGVARQVLTGRRWGGRHLVTHAQGRTFAVRAVKPLHCQIDGDPIGQVHSLKVRVEPGALKVRVASTDNPAAEKPE